ncbi:MAG: ATP-binding protein [Arcobacter sp.]|jgi:signal transduction histidine kinase|uniref:ATP-binding protein n=1 Tax=unclassified Arcobacter TaxID=2593671 RepID=UPI0002296548|nr:MULTISPECIES: ATP-binding protein [unclassified Arcobacter]MDY3199830.1 ATP-binding protein [Arcobacter sp.]BAK72625.1 two-component sensor kinase [Arcobacter sp. L]
MHIEKFRNFIEESILTIVIFLFLLFTSFFYFKFQLEKEIQTYLTNLKQLYATQYDTIYDNFNKLSQNSFYGIINKPEIYDLVKYAYKQDSELQSFYRERLYQKLISDYIRLKEYKFYQIHFHFPDNTSFLRMHEKDKFGDNLTKDRFSVKEVNENLKPVYGYEIGKMVDGFRFVYPLFDEKLFHIGSVELSVSSDFFEKNFETSFDVDVHFLIKKSIVEERVFKEYLKIFDISNENDEYLYKEDKTKELNHFTNENFYTNEERNLIKIKMKNSENFSIYKKINGNYIAISFLSIKNTQNEKNAAYMVLYKNSDFIKQVMNNYHKMILILILISIIFVFYINYRYKKIQEEKNKEYILSQQTKMVALGEMIQNISHQWRQPLSVISVLASGLKLKKEVNILEDKEFFESLDGILHNTTYLSNTIEDFRNYFNESLEKRAFNLKDTILQCTAMFKEDLNAKNIILIENLIDIELFTYENDLKHVLINLLKNAKDFTKQGVILVEMKEEKNEIIIEIQDSAGGIPKNIIEKIFEPYFSTKHNSSGIGLGLYSAYEIITKKFNGNILVENRTFDYNFESYKGACFSIILDKKNLQ